MRVFTVTEKHKGVSVEKFLTGTFNAMPRSALHKAFRNKDIKVNGKRVDQSHIVNVGDSVTAYIADCVLMGIQEPQVKYEDENILVVNKPAGICVCDGPINELTLQDVLSEGLFPCHRLDRNTSGLVIFAKTEQSRDRICALIKDRDISKKYRTKVFGRPPKDADKVVSYMEKDAKKGMVKVYNVPGPNRLQAITGYKVLGKVNDAPAIYELEVTLYTGRTHQIRAQMAALGCPIVGDTKYGNYDLNKKLGYKHQELMACEIEIPEYEEGKSLVVRVE